MARKGVLKQPCVIMHEMGSIAMAEDTGWEVYRNDKHKLEYLIIASTCKQTDVITLYKNRWYIEKKLQKTFLS